MIDLPFVNHGRGQIDLSDYCVRQPIELQSTSVHFKEDGAVNDTPSIAFVCTAYGNPNAYPFIHQISLETLGGVLKKAGYLLVRAND